MDHCPGCGATLAADAQWCSQCYLPRQAGTLSPTTLVPAPAAPAAERTIMAGTRQEGALAPPAAMVKSRWRKSATTFGPVGRVVCTVLLFVPLPLMIFWTVVSGGFGILGLGAWAGVIMPMGLRDVWKAGLVPAG